MFGVFAMDNRIIAANHLVQDGWRATSCRCLANFGMLIVSVSGLPFDDIRDLISNLPSIDDRAKRHASERNTALVACLWLWFA